MVLVTGGTGMVGSFLVRKLQRLGFWPQYQWKETVASALAETGRPSGTSDASETQ